VGYFILGSWYTEKELGKRIALVFVAGPAGQAFSGFMQAGIYTSMNGLAGLAGWRWLYIICGIISESASALRVLYNTPVRCRGRSMACLILVAVKQCPVPRADALARSRPMRADVDLDPA
jgi:MFS family permease